MRDIRVATAQFEARDDDAPFNLGRMRELAARGASAGAEIVCFHECSLSGYTFLQRLDRAGLAAVAEPVPDGPSVQGLIGLARELGIAIGAGLVESDEDHFYNTYVLVDADGIVARHRKLHTFVSPHMSPGGDYTVVNYRGVRIGILICYDNNLPENVRITSLMGAEVILMPHVTCCTPSPMPGRGLVDRALWENRTRDPVRLRMEFQGPKGRGWLMKWLPARAWENGIYAVFSNPIGVDGDTIKPGLAMIVDPDGEVLVESGALGDDVVVGLLTAEGYDRASGRRYIRARRPDLYQQLVAPPPPGWEPLTLPGWRRSFDESASDSSES